MPIFGRGYKPILTDSDESEDIPLASLSKKPSPRICKCSPSVLAELGPKGKLQASHPRFGPFYREDESEVSGKTDAWDKILEKSSDKKKTLESYLSAMRRVEKDARDAYGDEALCNLPESEFRWMMIKDGCFFLQLALLVLGVSSRRLGYPDNHIIFGKKQNENVKRWIEAMFFVGNQIPLVVLNELMKQQFFKDILAGGISRDVASNSFKWILHRILVLPALKHHNQITGEELREGFGGRAYLLEQQPSDLLHALHCFMFGVRSGGRDLVKDETWDDDLEAGPDLEAKDLTLSAKELDKKGIFFLKSDPLVGCGKIPFKDYRVFACLWLPTITFDESTELMWKRLVHYEMSQEQGKSQYVVTSYLKFMNDLLCTYDDVRLLAKKGIIEADNNRFDKNKLRTMLSKLAGKDKNTTQDLHQLRIQLRDYNLAPWERFKIVAILIFIFTFIQAFFAIFAYVRPPRAPTQH